MMYLRFVCSLILMLSVGVARADSVSDELQVRLKTLKTMSAHFTQIVKARQRSLSRASGTMALSRPGRFRWQTDAPMSQLVIASGSKIWVYDEELEQVSVKKQTKEINGTAGVFLSGDHDNISRDFNVMLTQHGLQNVYDLHAKSHKESIQHLKLIFTGETLTGIELFDQLGQHTIIHLNHIKTNIVLASSLFQFNIPKGVDVVQQ